MLQPKRSFIRAMMDKHTMTEEQVINRIKEMSGQPEARWEIIEDMTGDGTSK